jgi:hypothetical protein
MSTATATATAAETTLQELTDLQSQATEEVARHREELEKIESSHNETMNELLSKIRDTANGACGDFQTSSPSAAPTPKRRGRPPGKKNASGSSTATPPAKKSVKKKAGAVAASERNYDNKKKLPEAIWDILDRDDWPILKDLPEDAVGLTAGEVKKLILHEKDWQSSSADPGNQISAQLGKFRNAGKIARGEGRRYYIVEGSTLEG